MITDQGPTTGLSTRETGGVGGCDRSSVSLVDRFNRSVELNGDGDRAIAVALDA